MKNILKEKSDINSKWILFSLLLLVVITFAIYKPVLNNEFVDFDDNELIINNHLVYGGNSVSFNEIFKAKIFTPHYKPLVFLSWNIENRFFGLDPFYFHLNNLLLHLLNIILVFLITIKINIRLSIERWYSVITASFIALLFALHPLHVESVAWATERKDVLFTFFYLLSIFFYVKHFNSKLKWIWIFIASVFYLFTILSKSMGITLIGVLFLVDYLYNEKLVIKLLLSKLPFLIIFIFALYIYGMFSGFVTQASGLTSGIANEGFVDYPDNLIGLPSFYIRILIINIRLILWLVHILIPILVIPIYPSKVILESLGVFVHLFPLITIGLLAFAYKYRNKYKVFLFGLLFFIITIFPALTISDKGVSVFISNRYTYVPSLGIIAILVSLFIYLSIKFKNKLISLVPLTVFILVFSISTNALVKTWQSSKTLWEYLLSYSTTSALPYNGLAYHYKMEGNYEKALKLYNSAIKTDPKYYNAYHGRAKIYFDREEYDLALKDYKKTVELFPSMYEAWSNMGAIEIKNKNYELAAKYINKSMKINPNQYNTINNLVDLLMKTNKYEEAIEYGYKYLKLKPNDALMYSNVGLSYVFLDKYEEAIKVLSLAIKYDNTNGVYYLNRAFAYFKNHNKELSIKDALKARELGSLVSDRQLEVLREGVK